MFGKGKAIKNKAELISKKVMPAILDAIKNCKAKGAKFDIYQIEPSQRKKSKTTPSWVFSVVYELESGFKYKEMLEAELLASTRKFQSQNKIPNNITDLTASVLGDKGIRISYEVLD
tara:strand:- start:685 stop:1035 length:351 start_codon:yes stop_codon:yes gene_type:complete